MRVRQHVYLGFTSDDVAPDEITARLRIAPDEASPRGCRDPGPPPRPRFHLWHLRSGVPESASIGDHLAALLTRIRPHEAAMTALLDQTRTNGRLQIVRYFESGPEDEGVADIDRILPGGLERLRGQHPLLGFHLDKDLLLFVIRVGLEIDVDEYGDEDE